MNPITSQLNYALTLLVTDPVPCEELFRQMDYAVAYDGDAVPTEITTLYNATNSRLTPECAEIFKNYLNIRNNRILWEVISKETIPVGQTLEEYDAHYRALREEYVNAPYPYTDLELPGCTDWPSDLFQACPALKLISGVDLSKSAIAGVPDEFAQLGLKQIVIPDTADERFYHQLGQLTGPTGFVAYKRVIDDLTQVSGNLYAIMNGAKTWFEEYYDLTENLRNEAKPELLELIERGKNLLNGTSTE